MNYPRVVGTKLLIKPDNVDESAGGVYLPESARKAPLEGEIVSLSAKTTHLKIGDRILYQRNAGTELNWGKEDLRILYPLDVLARIEVL